MLAYLANTLIFIMVGVVIMEKALNSLNEYDLFLLVVDYFGITVIRFVSLKENSPPSRPLRLVLLKPRPLP